MAPPLLPPPTRAILRHPSSRAAEGLTDADLGAPDPAVTAAQHAAYVAALRDAGLRDPRRRGRLLVAPLMHVTDPTGLEGLDLHVVADADAYAANVVPLGHTTLVAAGFPAVAELVGQHGPVSEVPMGDFERMDGGLTCLSLRW